MSRLVGKCPACGSPLGKNIGQGRRRCQGVGCGEVYQGHAVRPKRLRARNPERRAAMHERNFGSQARVIREELLCLVAGHITLGRDRCRGRIQAAHVVPRGMGGCNSSASLTVPLCAHHHAEQEGATAEFETKYGLCLVDEAERLAEMVARRRAAAEEVA